MKASKIFQAPARRVPSVEGSVNYFPRIATANLTVIFDGNFESTGPNDLPLNAPRLDVGDHLLRLARCEHRQHYLRRA